MRKGLVWRRGWGGRGRGASSEMLSDGGRRVAIRWGHVGAIVDREEDLRDVILTV